MNVWETPHERRGNVQRYVSVLRPAAQRVCFLEIRCC